ncbi:MAG: hypothetical protein Q4G35_07875 [Propionibacteriaceae bacterium]|nr:hypothetical protein [Propionibacteriaceae bacterium]
MNTDNPALSWFPATCPTWCQGKHEPVLAAQDDPHGDLCTFTAPSVVHSRELDDFAVTLDEFEHHPAAADNHAAPAPAVFVYLPGWHDTHGTTPAQLRRWAHALTRAADAADAYLKDPQP